MMRKRSSHTAVATALVLCGAILLLVSESRSASAFLKAHVPMPGLWELGFVVAGWQLVIAPPIILAATIARRSTAKPLRVTGGVLSLLSIISLVGINGFFTWVMISWGLATNWTFTK